MKVIIEKYTEISSIRKDCEVIKVSILKKQTSRSLYFRFEEENGKVKCI
jgi:hypothetical protein